MTGDAGRFAVGQPVRRTEDPKLLRGEGHYCDDLAPAAKAHAVMVRSAYAHGHLRGIERDAALTLPGVLGIYTAEDLRAGGVGPMPATIGTNRGGAASRPPRQHPLAEEKVRYVGDPIACVVAETLQQARDAAEAVFPMIDPLPAVTSAAAAVAPGAPLLYDDVPDNVAHDFHFGDSARVEEAFSAAAHVTRLNLDNSRVVVCPMEPRSAVGEYVDGRWILHVGCQGVFGLRALLMGVLNASKEQIRVLTGNVGGSFGMKASCFPEYVAVLFAARALGRPVKWTDERSGSFVSDSHGRDHQVTAELALNAQGRFLALRLHGVANVGAYLSNATFIPPTINTVKNLVSVYQTPLIEVSSRCAFTNTTPVGAYRGAGRPEGNYYMERLVDTAAREMGIDVVELRRRNHIRPDQLPYAAPSGLIYDSGDFPGLLDTALINAEWDGYAGRCEESRAHGKVRGRGIGQYLEVTGPPVREMGGIRFEADGTVTIITGTLDYGQGHAAPFAQILAEKLGIPFERISLLQGDSDELLAGGGTGGSKSLVMSGTAIIHASERVIETGKQAAAHMLEASVADIEFSLSGSSGEFRIAGTDRGVGILELAGWLRGRSPHAPEPVNTLDVSLVDDGAPSTFPNGCHIAEVELDPETGVLEVVRYTMVNDFGTVVNPLLVAGQLHGGIAQGIGQATLEHTVYDQDGQLLTGSFMDYALPRATHVPHLSWTSRPTLALTNPLGVKGCGEAGCAGSLPAVMNAVVDALGPFGVRHIDMPASTERVWAALRATQDNKGEPGP